MESRKSFDPANAGTAECRWASLLSHVGEWLPKQGPLFVVAPHPDDEILGAGGLVQSWVASGKLKVQEDVINGLENTPKALIGLLAGENRGKRMVKV